MVDKDLDNVRIFNVVIIFLDIMDIFMDTYLSNVKEHLICQNYDNVFEEDEVVNYVKQDDKNF